MYKDSYFTFDALNTFNEYRDSISLSADAETKQSAVLLKKDNIDSYFKQYCEKNIEIEPKDEALWKQVSEEAEKYKAISAKIVVMPQKDFKIFLQEKGINNSDLEQNEEMACVLILPDYNKALSNPSVKEKGIIQLGGLRGNEKRQNFLLKVLK